MKNDSLSVWQVGIVLFILLFANKVLALPSLLYDSAKTEAIFIPIVSFCLEMGLVLLFCFLKTKFPKYSFFCICKDNLGSFFAYSLYIMFLLFFLCKAVLLYNFTFIFFKNLIYKDSNNFIYLICIIPVINHLALLDCKVLGRTSQLFFPIIFLITLFCIVVGVFGISTTPLFFSSSFSDVLVVALKHISSFGDSIFLFLVMDKVRFKKKGDWKVLCLLSFMSMVLVVVIICVFVFSYCYTAFMHPFALFEIMSYVKEYGGMGKIDIIAMVLIILFTYFHLAIYLKAFVIAFNNLFRKTNTVYSIITFDISFIMLIDFLILNLERAVFYGENILPYFEIFPFVILPIVVAIICFLANRKRKKVMRE